MFQRKKEWICESRCRQVGDRLHVFARFFLSLNLSTTTIYARSAFYPSLRFTLSLQSAVCIYPWSAVCSPQSAVCSPQSAVHSLHSAVRSLPLTLTAVSLIVSQVPPRTLHNSHLGLTSAQHMFFFPFWSRNVHKVIKLIGIASKQYFIVVT